jgi:hypothetical protein
LTRITTTSTSIVDFPSFGATGAYMKIAGTYEGELDPADPHNAVIVDIDLAPKTAGKVHYTSTFFILRPVDLSRGNGKLFYDSGNRGGKRILEWFNDATPSNDPTSAAEFGNGFLMRQGYIVALNGYSGDVAPGPDVMSITLPIAKNPDGSSITGDVVAEGIPTSTTGTTVNLPYAAATMSPTNGVLTVREHALDPRIPVAGWNYVNSRRISFPGPAKIEWIYEFVYTAKDPMVMGIGHAATRDFLSFLKHGVADDDGKPNPVAMAGGLRAIYHWGRSNGGRHVRDLIRWGFNEDENGKMVFDGVMPYATGSGGLMWTNYRFSQPGVSQQQHSRHFSHEYEFPHTLPVMTDPLTGQTDGIFKRCLATNTCPKYFNIDSANEYWNKSNSLNHTDAFGNDLPPVETLAPNARLYFIASTQHNTTFDDVAAPDATPPVCQQWTNPLYNGPVFRALAVALDQWVSTGTLPPPSQVPHRNDGTLVPPDAVAFPSIPATQYAGWPAFTAVEFNPKTMSRNAPLDFSVVPYQPLAGPEYVVQVPQVDADGNDIAGIRLPFLSAPTGTYTGWAVLRPGAGDPDICGQLGQFIPFANTKAERLAAGDPRLSLEERYKNRGAYVSAVARAAARLVQQRFLLDEDADRIVGVAAQQGVQFRAPH